MESPSRHPRVSETAVVLGFWGVVGVLLTAIRTFERTGPARPDDPFVTVVVVSCAMWAALTPVVFALARRYPIERTGWAPRGALHVGVAALAVFAVDRAIDAGVMIAGVASVPAGAPPGPRAGRFIGFFVVYAAILAVGHALAYVGRARRQEAEALRLQAEAARLESLLVAARLDALRAQLNPHFLFNALNAVSALAGSDPAGVRRVVARLSALLRRVLDGSTAREVTLADELALVDDYLDVQRVRLGDALRVTVDVPGDLRDALVPGLVLQPLVENAVEHGVARLEDRPGRIALAAARDGDALVLTVRDDGPDADGPPGDGVGLRNTRARLAALYGPAGALDAAADPAGGFVARVRLPYHTAADLALAAGPAPAP